MVQWVNGPHSYNVHNLVCMHLGYCWRSIRPWPLLILFRSSSTCLKSSLNCISMRWSCLSWSVKINTKSLQSNAVAIERLLVIEQTFSVYKIEHRTNDELAIDKIRAKSCIPFTFAMSITICMLSVVCWCFSSSSCRCVASKNVHIAALVHGVNVASHCW